MTKISELSAAKARDYFLTDSSYFNADFPTYISFQPILKAVSECLEGKSYREFKSFNPDQISGVNYIIIANKDGRFAWRPLELMNPAIYVSLVDLMCAAPAWATITERLAELSNTVVTCCSAPVLADNGIKDQAAQILNWWQAVEQQSLCYALEFSHVLHTDVTDCYGSIYTHSISWAIHGLEEAKKRENRGKLLGDKIDEHIRAGRFGQTNGICQGSVLMDFIAELVLAYVDQLIAESLGPSPDYRILRYRDDYRVFTNSDVVAERVLKVISDTLRNVGMKLGVAKTYINRNVIEGSVKPDKLAGIELQDLGISNAKTIQKQLLRLHAFGRRYPNSGALRRLVAELHAKIVEQQEAPDDLDVQVAIAADLAVVSPSTFPAVAGILSHMISLQDDQEKANLWERVHKKMSTVPYNGYQEIWLQRVTKPAKVGIEFVSEESICRVVNGEDVPLWDNSWVSSQKLKDAMKPNLIIVSDASATGEVIKPSEVELFAKSAALY